MGKFDDLFNEHFGDTDFGGPDKKERAKSLFNLLMSDLDEETLKNIDLSKILNHISDTNQPSIFDNVDDVNHIIEEYNLSLSEINLYKQDKQFIVTETWNSEERGYLMEQKYLLNREIFSEKENKIKIMIVDSMIKDHYLGNMEQGIYLTLLSTTTQIKYYNILMEESVKNENYEDASIYRDTIKVLESK